MLSGIGSTIAQGAVGAVANSFGGSKEQPAQVQNVEPIENPGSFGNDACSQDKQMYFDCLKQNNGDQNSCNFLYTTLKSCQSGSSQMSFQ